MPFQIAPKRRFVGKKERQPKALVSLFALHEASIRRRATPEEREALIRRGERETTEERELEILLLCDTEQFLLLFLFLV